MRIFEKAFKPPFKNQIFGRIVDSEYNFCFTIIRDNNEELVNKIIRVINGEENFKNPKLNFKKDSVHIIMCDEEHEKELILIRGWGYLTGVGGLNLSEEEAIEIQNDLADYIVERLNDRSELVKNKSSKTIIIGSGNIDHINHSKTTLTTTINKTLKEEHEVIKAQENLIKERYKITSRYPRVYEDFDHLIPKHLSRAERRLMARQLKKKK